MSMIGQMETITSTSVKEVEVTKQQKKTRISGKTIGEPKLTEKAQEYYEKLKKKYSNMDFILVSKDMKEQAKAQAGSYANANRMVVLIDEEKIERMAVDEEYRKQYESIISGATAQMSQLKNSLGSAASGVKGFGMQVNDNGAASFFAVMDKSFEAQNERLEKLAEKKKAAKKAAKEEAQEKIEEKREEKRAKEKEALEENVTITASSIEELIAKIQDMTYEEMSDYAQTDEEKMVGQHIDFFG